MRIHLTAFLLAPLLLTLCAPASAQTQSRAQAAPAQPMSEVTLSNPVTTATLAGRAIHLGERDGKCAVLRGDEVFPLGIGAPCYFSIARDRSAQVHHFHGSNIVLVQHAHQTASPDRDIKLYGAICAFESQSVREVDDVLEAGIVASSWHCDPTRGADQKEFVYSYDTWPKRDAAKPSRKRGTP